MAENKKSFILYADQKALFDQLSNEKAGELIKFILAYVNDEDPKTDDIIINLAFTPIKQQLKRDLEKFEKIKIKRSEAGKKSAELRYGTKNEEITKPNKSQQTLTSVNKSQQTLTNLTDNDNDNVNDNDNDNVINKDIHIQKFDFKKSCMSLGFDSKLLSEWMLVRKNKKLTNTESALQKFLDEINKTGKDKNEVLRICVENSWGGFNAKWLEKEEVSKQQNFTPTQKLKKWN